MAADSLAADLAAAVAAVFKRLPMRIANAFFAYLNPKVLLSWQAVKRLCDGMIAR